MTNECGYYVDDGDDDDDIFIFLTDSKKNEIVKAVKIDIGDPKLDQLCFLSEYCLEFTWKNYLYANDHLDYKD